MLKRFSITLLLLCPFFIQCEKVEYQSKKVDQPIIIDGSYSDWPDNWCILRELTASIGIAHDNQFLYFCFRSFNRQLPRMIITRGLILNFNPEGKKKPYLSIIFHPSFPKIPHQTPIPEQMPTHRPPFGEKPPYPSQPPQFGERTQRNAGNIPEPVGEMELFKELEIREKNAKSGTVLKIEELKGVAIKAGRQRSEFIYEMRIPLCPDSSYSFALNFQPAKPLAIGIKIPELDLSKFRNIPKPSNLPPGSISGKAGDFPRDFPGGQISSPRFSPEATEVWLKVRIEN